MQTAYLHIFVEALWNSSLIPFATEATFFAMNGFGGYDMNWALVFAVLGCLGGHSFNWLLGTFIKKLYEHGKIKVSPEGYAKYQRFYRRYFIFTLLLTWVPFMNITVLLAGFYNVRYRTAISLALVGETLNYLSVMLPA